jgi:hypothetical protein
MFVGVGLMTCEFLPGGGFPVVERATLPCCLVLRFSLEEGGDSWWLTRSVFPCHAMLEFCERV